MTHYYFTIDEKHNSIDLTEKGIDLINWLREKIPTSSSFLTLVSEVAKLEESILLLTKLKNFRKKEEVIQDYSVKAQRIHSVNQLLRAYCLYEKGYRVHRCRRQSKDCR